VATVEMAFVLPILLVLTLGTATLAHAVITRFLMHSAAYDAARMCALARTATQACVMNVVHEKLAKTKTESWCNSGIQGVVSDPAALGLEAVNVLQVELRCDFVGGVGTKYLAQRGLTIATITARAAMPH
jgi:Flp pilus assembly protein TadG